MGLQAVDVICSGLVEYGMPETTPAALVQQGTMPEQQIYIGDLSRLPQIVREHQVKAPTLIIVGEVVQLHDKLNWFNAQEHR